MKNILLFQFLTFAALVAVARAGVLGPAAPLAYSAPLAYGPALQKTVIGAPVAYAAGKFCEIDP